MTFRVEITARARDEADAIFAWTAENRSPGQAEVWYRGLFEEIESLTRQPARCPVARESRKLPEEVRELVLGKPSHRHRYRILFTLRGDLVTVLSIHHSARADFEP